MNKMKRFFAWLLTWLPGKSDSLKKAERLAKFFYICPNVLGVQLFGSIAYLGAGRDVDLIILVADDIAAEFLRKLDKHDDGYFDTKQFRVDIALSLLGLESRRDEIATILGDTMLDIFLLPLDWHIAPKVSKVLDRYNPNFVAVLLKQYRQYHYLYEMFLSLGFFKTYFGKYLASKDNSNWRANKNLFQ